MANDHEPSSYTMNLGSNILENCDGTILYKRGKGDPIEVFKLEKRGADLSLSIDIREEGGKTVGRVVRNSFVTVIEGYDAKSDFEIKRSPNELSFTRRRDGKALLKAVIDAKGIVAVTGEFVIGSHKLEVTWKEFRIINLQRRTLMFSLSGVSFNGFGTAVLITPKGGFSLGGPKS